MILWTINLLSTVKKVIAGRKHPHQLAWAAGFGILLGIVPHGNLLAVGILILVLSLRINHAMVGLTAIATTFLVASRLDPISHLIGDAVLMHPEVNPIAVSLWKLPLVPWTDLNNTVVLGSFLFGVASLVPVFVLTYPMFRLLAPRGNREANALPQYNEQYRVDQRPADARKKVDSANQVIMVDRGHDRVGSPHKSQEVQDDHEVAEPSQTSLDNDDSQNRIAVQTRIDVIRMKGDSQSSSDSTVPNYEQSTTDTTANNEQPMDEALNYLLRQLRDSQQRSAA